jgi:outer membrane protein assembly factor BamB
MAKIGTPLITGNLAIVAGGSFRGDDDSGRMIAYDVASGNVAWEYDPAEHGTPLDDIYAPVLDGGVLYAGSYSTGGAAAILMVDPASGGETWRYPLPDMWHVETPTIAGGLAYSGAFSYDIDRGGIALAVDPAARELKWREPTGLDAVYVPKYHDGFVYAGTFNSEGDAALLKLDAATGDEQWRFTPVGNHGGILGIGGDPGQDFVDSPTIVDGVLYVGIGTWDVDGEGALYALTPEREVLWRFDPQPPVDLVYSPVLVDGVAYAGTSDSSGAVLLAIIGNQA